MLKTEKSNSIFKESAEMWLSYNRIKMASYRFQNKAAIVVLSQNTEKYPWKYIDICNGNDES